MQQKQKPVPPGLPYLGVPRCVLIATATSRASASLATPSMQPSALPEGSIVLVGTTPDDEGGSVSSIDVMSGVMAASAGSTMMWKGPRNLRTRLQGTALILLAILENLRGWSVTG